MVFPKGKNMLGEEKQSPLSLPTVKHGEVEADVVSGDMVDPLVEEYGDPFPVEENGLVGSITSEVPTDEQDGERRESELPFLSRRLIVLFQQAWSSHIFYFGKKINIKLK